MDVVAGSRGETRILWLENLGARNGAPPVFVEHRIEIRIGPDAAALGELRFEGFNLAFHDFNGDGRLDIVLPAMGSGGVGWIEQLADPRRPWTFHPIGTMEPDEVVGITLADINGDGHPDLMTGSYSRGRGTRMGKTSASAIGSAASRGSRTPVRRTALGNGTILYAASRHV